MPGPRLRAEWKSYGGGDAGRLSVVEPTVAEIVYRAEALAAAYNDPHNRAMIGNTVAFTPNDVALHYEAMAARGARPFFLYEGATLAGDADLRSMTSAPGEGSAGELAILILDPRAQGRGLGTRFSLLLHAIAFGPLGLDRVYVTILPENVASQRLFAKLGYLPDSSPAARRYADGADDLSFSLEKSRFERAHAADLTTVKLDAIGAL